MSYDEYVCQVSVPLRGLWFLSKRKAVKFDEFEVLVSVPLRGLWFLSEVKFYGKQEKTKFPSPCGDYGSYRNQEIFE